MSRWKRRVEELLYDGESVEESIDIGTARVVVTSHRVLAFTPEMEGENFVQTDLPNVEAVDVSSEAEDNLLERGVRFAVIGGVLIATGLLVDFGSIFGDVSFDTEAAQQVGAGGLMALAQRVMSFMLQLDYLLRVFGVLALFLAAVMLGVYWFLRDPTLRITVAGENPNIHLPRPSNVSATRTRLESAIFPDEQFDVTETDSGFGLNDGGTEAGQSQWGETESVSFEESHTEESREDILGNAGTGEDDAVGDS